MKYQFYNKLPDEAQYIREKVFVEEQGFEKEFDDIDHHCIHLVVFEDELPIGCARMYGEGETMILGRIAVLQNKRELHIGSEILNQLEIKTKKLGYKTTTLSAQVRAKGFYKKNGYQEVGEEYLDEYCPHTVMTKEL